MVEFVTLNIIVYIAFTDINVIIYAGDIMPLRHETKEISIGKVKIGGNNPVVIQSMTTTSTKDIEKTVAEIKYLESLGCELIRVAVLDIEDAKAIKKIKEQISIPLAADIHYDYKLAIASIENGADKIRLNPGNLRNIDEVKLVTELCKKKKIPIRIGVNGGSLPKGMALTAENMVLCCEEHVKILEELDFYDIVLSLKASSVDLTVKAYLLASEKFPYPLHLGVTEAGTEYKGTIKSSIGLGIMLHHGIGNTIRVSLNGDKGMEIKAAKEILNNFGLIDNIPELICCPTCGRSQYPDIQNAAKEIESFLETIKANIKVAVMGCSVNGPGEAKHADIGIAYGKHDALIFIGKTLKKVSFSDSIKTFKNEIIKLLEESGQNYD